MPKVIVLPGDGIGSEVIWCALQVLNKVAPDLEYAEFASALAFVAEIQTKPDFLMQTSVCT